MNAQVVIEEVEGCLQVLTAQVQQFVKEMQAGGPASGDPSAQALHTSNGSSTTKVRTSEVPASEKDAGKTQQKHISGRIGQKRTYKTEEKFYARAQDIFECFVNPQKIQAYTQSQAKVSQTTPPPLSLSLPQPQYSIGKSSSPEKNLLSKDC